MIVKKIYLPKKLKSFDQFENGKYVEKGKQAEIKR